MTVAGRAALLSGVIGAAGVFLVVVAAGLGVLLVGVVIGFLGFALGLFHGHGPLTSLGLAVVALTAGVAVDDGAGGLVALIGLVGIGVAASAALVAADASWWLRRDARIDLEVASGLARTLGPAWGVGAVLGAGAILMSRHARITIWLLPAGILATAGLTAVLGLVTRSRHRRPDPQADRRYGREARSY
jgi:hypothetical protein